MSDALRSSNYSDTLNIPPKHRAKPNYLKNLKKELLDSYRYRNVSYSYVEMNLKLRYRKSLLGFFWSFLTPLFSYLVIGLVFSKTGKMKVENFFVYFFAGSVFFSFLTATIVRSPIVMLENENFIKKIYVPKLIFLVNVIALETVNFLLGLSVLLILGLITGRISPHLTWLALPVAVLTAVVTMIGLGCILSITAVFFRDLVHIVPLLMQSLFFLTPVMYPIALLGPELEKLEFFNPFYHLVEFFREPLTSGMLPSAQHVLFSFAFALFVFVVGLLVLNKFDNRIVFKL